MVAQHKSVRPYISTRVWERRIEEEKASLPICTQIILLFSNSLIYTDIFSKHYEEAIKNVVITVQVSTQIDKFAP